MWRTLLVLIVLTAVPSAADAQERRIDLRIPGDSSAIQRLATRDGSQVYGRVETIGDDSIEFRTIDGGLLTIEVADLVELRVVEGRVVNEEVRLRDPHASRLFIGPTARSLRRGEGYVTLQHFMMPSMQVGITDRVSIGAATPLYFFGEAHPFVVTPKVQLLAREKLQFAAGTIHLLNVTRDATGIVYGVATVGSRDTAATVALGYAFRGGERRPIVMLGGEGRQNRRVKWFAESWLLGPDAGLVSFGARLLRERYSTDLGLVVPLSAYGFVAAPMINLTWSF
jgi:hypothetical protein